ncbi:MAG: cryptochrome/photolyase family protein [Cohaesibacteraceae bacterium]
MPALRLVLGDQLTRSLSSLKDWQTGDLVLMCEVAEETSYVRHHKKKIAFILSAMRHFARVLESAGLTVRYVRLDDRDNTGSFAGEIERVLTAHTFDRLIVTEPGEWRVMEMMRGWEDQLGVPVEVREDDRVLSSIGEFELWAQGRKQLRMEYFYRQMRRKTGFLMEGRDPIGGQWNFDQDNRKRLPKDLELPERLSFAPDAITGEVLTLVADRFGDHFGDLEPFAMPVTRDDALAVLEHFIAVCLPKFGDYQDALAEGEAFLFHSTISAALNCGLLTPGEVCEAADAAFKAGDAPLNAVEGFIRQILGWREYVRGLYWLTMPAYKERNALDAQRPLPEFYWTAETDMACIRDVVTTTRKHAYAHHIQRLMVTGNFALLAGLSPDEVNRWYMEVYADAYEWVELHNTHGMALFADGGIMASKPYAASGAYLNRMGDHCGKCAYDVKAKTGESACPFNYLYWDFVARNREVLGDNPRMGMMYRSLDRMNPETLSDIQVQAEAFLDAL